MPQREGVSEAGVKPLKALVIHRDLPMKWARLDGHFAYPVPEFTWDEQAVEKRFSLNLDRLDGCDFVWWDEGKYGQSRHFMGSRVPVVSQVQNFVVEAGMLRAIIDRARQNGAVVAVGHGALEPWQKAGLKAFSCLYSTNEQYYRPAEKTVDVGQYACWNYVYEREALDAWLADVCKRHGWTFGSNRGEWYQPNDYRDALARTKVIVTISRWPESRPVRLLDISASGGVLLTNRWSEGGWPDDYPAFDKPNTAGHGTTNPGTMRYTDRDCAEIEARLVDLLTGGKWQDVAARARQYVLEHDTWAVRAGELRGNLRKVLGL